MLLRSIENRTSILFSTLQQHLNVKTKSVLIQPVRCKNTINTLNPRNDHFWAKKMKLVYAPKKPREFDEHLPSSYKCRKQFIVPLRKLYVGAEENPYQRILANEIKDELMKSKMVLMIHRNPINGYECFEATKKFVKSGMNVITEGKDTVRMAVEDTKYANIMCLFHSLSITWLITCPEVKLHLALKLLKKMPYHVLLAGVVEDRFLTYQQMEKYAQVEDIHQARAQLLATLNAPTMQLAQNLTRHQSTTVAYLNEYVRMKSEAAGSTTSQTPDSKKDEDENKKS